MTDSESRVARRQKVLKSGKIIFNRNQSVVDCAVRDMSATGAKLVTKGAAQLPDDVKLLLTQENVIRDAHVVWRKSDLVGVHFTSDAVRAPPRKY
jgi:2-succinyl-5-enolpyruvyl-6-hydroxy-3-cyclohexene-1-carboxylate synthase